MKLSSNYRVDLWSAIKKTFWSTMEAIVIFKTCAITTSICIMLIARLGIDVRGATRIQSKVVSLHRWSMLMVKSSSTGDTISMQTIYNAWMNFMRLL